MAFTAQGITPEQIAALARSGPAPAPAPAAVPSQPFGGHVEQGRAFFRDQTGKVFSAPENEAGAALASDPTLQAASLDDVTKWRNRPGALEAASAQFGRGVLDAVLAPGALVAFGASGAGELFDSDTLRDFGRDLGRASSGSSAIEAVTYAATGETTSADSARNRIEEQEKAWPMLSTLSRMSGMAAFGLATGSLAAKGGISGAQLAATGALEGAAGGAQAGYEESGAFRDVAASLVLGAALGGTVGAAPMALSYAKRKGLEGAKRALSETSFETVGDLVGGAPGAAIGAIPDVADAVAPALRSGATAVRNAVTGGVEAAAARSEVQAVTGFLRKVQQGVRDAAEKAGANPEARLAAARQASADAVEVVSRKAGIFDATKWADTKPNALQKVFFRRQILDRASADLSGEIAEAASVRPILSTPLDSAKLSKLTRGIDETAAIGKVQQRLEQAIAETPAGEGGSMLREMLVTARRQMSEGGAVETMQAAHKAASLLDEFQDAATDRASQAFAKRAAMAIRDDLGSSSFGKAGQLYRKLNPTVSSTASDLSDPAVMREAMRTLQGKGALTKAVREHGESVRAAFDARARLTGEAPPAELRQAFAALEKRAGRAEEALTMDGGPVSEVLRFVQENAAAIGAGQAAAGVVGSAIGGIPGAMVGVMVANRVRPAVAKMLPHVQRVAKDAPAFAKQATTRGGTLLFRNTDEEREIYDDRMAFLSKAVLQPQSNTAVRDAATGLRDLPSPMQQQAVEEAQKRMANLLRDIPKPTKSIRGPAYEMLSRDEMRKANAMWEATVAPLTIFDDFESGLVDYTKVTYAWSQWPGLRQALQMGVIDMLQTQLDDKERENMPHGTLAQIDTILGFGGSLQPTLSPGFSARMTSYGQQTAQAEQPARPQGQLKLPATTETYTERIASRS